MATHIKICEDDYNLSPTELELHENATNLLQEHIRNTNAELLTEAKLIAYRRGADIVLKCHVDEVLQQNRQIKAGKYGREFMLLVGAALFGAFADGFLPQLFNGNALLIILYVAFGLIGIVLVLFALQK